VHLEEALENRAVAYDCRIEDDFDIVKLNELLKLQKSLPSNGVIEGMGDPSPPGAAHPTGWIGETG
jgi:hypothetical protein